MPSNRFLCLKLQWSFEQIVFDSPEEPIRIAKDDLRQRLSTVFPEIHHGPGHCLLPVLMCRKLIVRHEEGAWNGHISG